jgi:hypothetical protein
LLPDIHIVFGTVAVKPTCSGLLNRLDHNFFAFQMQFDFILDATLCQ